MCIEVFFADVQNTLGWVYTCWLNDSILLVSCSLGTGLDGGSMEPEDVSAGPPPPPPDADEGDLSNPAVMLVLADEGGVGVPRPSSSVDTR